MVDLPPAPQDRVGLDTTSRDSACPARRLPHPTTPPGATAPHASAQGKALDRARHASDTTRARGTGTPPGRRAALARRHRPA